MACAWSPTPLPRRSSGEGAGRSPTNLGLAIPLHYVRASALRRPQNHPRTRWWQPPGFKGTSVDVHPRGNDTSKFSLLRPPRTAQTTLGVQFLRVFLYTDLNTRIQFILVQLHNAHHEQEDDDRTKLGEFRSGGRHLDVDPTRQP